MEPAAPFPSPNPSWWQRNRLHLAIFGVSLCILAATSADRMFAQSRAPHFVYQADAFLHGQLNLRVPPPNDNDWVLFEGKHYVSFPPVPAVLMTPFVALFGLGFNDVLFTLFFGALNVLLMFLILQRLRREGLGAAGTRENLWLTALFGFGTLHYVYSVLGEVWFTAQIVGVTFSLLYILCAIRAERPVLAGLCLALAYDCRVNLAFTAIFFLAQLVFPRQTGGRPAAGSWMAALRKLVLFGVPIAVVGGAQMLMNHARFHSAMEFGHVFLGGPAGRRIQEHGLFSWHYLEWNLHALLLRLPVALEKFPWIGYNADGMSIFLTTPLFVQLFWPRARPWMYPLLWAAAVPALLPPLFYQNSGYVQFGYRFALDITPYFIMLLAVGKMPLNRWTKALILLSIAVNMVGAIAFKRSGPI
jgi:hypothetical protein